MEQDQLYRILRGDQKLNGETLSYLESVVKQYPYFQLAWMLYLKNLKDTDHPDYEKMLKTVAVMLPDRKQLYSFLNRELEKKDSLLLEAESSDYRLEEDGVRHSGQGLIDRFLSGESVDISKEEQRRESLSAEYIRKVADQSVEENDEIVTEALALIYFEQKNYEKAQRAFQKLSLKYPEKSVYFATRIKEIEKLKNL